MSKALIKEKKKKKVEVHSLSASSLISKWMHQEVFYTAVWQIDLTSFKAAFQIIF